MSQARVVVSKTEDQRFYEVKVPYNINQINMIRSVEGRRWDRDRKLWILPRTKEADADGKKVILDLQQARWIRIIRHVKIRPEANPYDPAWTNYFAGRKMNKRFCNLDRRFVEEFGLSLDRGRL
ncbi:MAG: hypothetical protein A2248_08930 [Candidatus Raymondbacteria bacterium RIFOXYA2_FULL_49_16]|nr:MAG: hypothetical protein A2248_08930 [Candidatus Raymondbacteria bacterium RIFOXYA2_FULL_49_16]OGP45607.1 MAG: hypothetical protein A2324_04530 [Candidatus Raymondbacteria bacterium RIFOXYB2_FULL_49_35]